MSKKSVHVVSFNTAARKAVNRLGLWILVALYKHPPQIVSGHIEVRLGEMRDQLESADDDHRRWLRARITAWTWVQRWVKDLHAHRFAELRRLASLAAEEIKKSSDATIPPRAPTETFAGWKRRKAA